MRSSGTRSPRTSAAITATATGAVRIAPAATRRARSRISRRRSAASSSSHPGSTSTRYPAAATARSRSSTEASVRSNSTSARSRATSAWTRRTPGRGSRADETVRRQVGQDAPGRRSRTRSGPVGSTRTGGGSPCPWPPGIPGRRPSPSPAVAPSSGAPGTAWPPSPAGSTTSRPCTMFIPHEKRNSPGRAGSSSTVVRAKAGSVRRTRKSGNTTSEVHSPASCRSNVMRSGTPWRTRITAGEYPPLTATRTSWTRPRSSARPASLGPKKNQSSHAPAAAPATVTSSSLIPPPPPRWPGPRPRRPGRSARG